jgi:hypothetical protein
MTGLNGPRGHCSWLPAMPSSGELTELQGASLNRIVIGLCGAVLLSLAPLAGSHQDRQDRQLLLLGSGQRRELLKETR